MLPNKGDSVKLFSSKNDNFLGTGTCTGHELIQVEADDYVMKELIPMFISNNKIIDGNTVWWIIVSSLKDRSIMEGLDVKLGGLRRSLRIDSL